MSDREDFEEAAARMGYSLRMRDPASEDGEYGDRETQCAWDMWQECCDKAAREQEGGSGEAVAWLVDRPSPWKPKVFLSNSDALRFSDSRHDASKPLPLICPQPADGWIKCSELTLEHADERGEVWGLDDIGNVDLVKAGSLLDGWHSHLVAFRPTGLKRPNPPNEGAE